MSRPIHTIECRSESHTVSLPDETPSHMQIVFLRSDEKDAEQLVVLVPRAIRHDLAMKLLAADGMQVRVTLTQPSHPCAYCRKPVRPLNGEERLSHTKCSKTAKVLGT